MALLPDGSVFVTIRAVVPVDSKDGRSPCLRKNLLPDCDFLRLRANNRLSIEDYRCDSCPGVNTKPMTTPALEEQFQTLVEEHKKILYKVCNSYCRNRDDRDDLAQEIIIQLWRSFGTFDERYVFSTWMYRIALNVAISFYRRESTRTRHVISDEEHLLEAIDDTDSQPEDIRLLYRFIEGLDPLNKALILLYLDGNSYQEIADVLGISETNVATKISRLKKTMKQEFSGTGRA
jgi:RNA polymerase sigma factor (sigma-70 family)